MAALANIQAIKPATIWAAAAFLFIAVLAGTVLLFSAGLRRFLLRGKREEHDPFREAAPRADDPGAFMTAAMQSVIQRLREQEKELEALHRQDKERAQQTERLSDAVTHNMPAGLLLVNSAGIVTSANPAAETALGIRSLAYRRFTELFPADSALSRLLTGCLQQAETFRREEVQYTMPSGEVRQLGVTISPILSPAGKVTGALCLLSDLTELKVLQEQIRLQENLAALGVLSAGIAHEFKNALATISGYAQMIRSEAEPGEVHENALRIVEQTRALTHVVTEFLKFARPLELADEDVPLQNLLERVVEEVRQVLPDVDIMAEGDFADVIGDEGLLRQALLNVTRNAAEAAATQEHRGRVTLRGSIERSAGREFQRLAILDNGPGLPADDLAKVFLPFYTTKAGGTGLGLAIVQKIVVQHGGRVEARSTPQGGAEFILWLPLRHPSVRTVETRASAV